MDRSRRTPRHVRSQQVMDGFNDDIRMVSREALFPLEIIKLLGTSPCIERAQFARPRPHLICIDRHKNGRPGPPSMLPKPDKWIGDGPRRWTTEGDGTEPTLNARHGLACEMHAAMCTESCHRLARPRAMCTRQESCCFVSTPRAASLRGPHTVSFYFSPSSSPESRFLPWLGLAFPTVIGDG